MSTETLGEAAAPAQSVTLAAALAQIAAGARALDAHPRFPAENLQILGDAGVTRAPARREPGGLAGEIALVRAVAAADASTARILDGHFNGVERLALLAPDPLREQELEAIARGALLLGVWGADPLPHEGSPARLAPGGEDGALLLRGTKSFCSGAGGLQRALVIARDGEGARTIAYIDTREGLEIDRSWYRASGLRASESHLVHFHDTPVLALLGGPGELMREPYISRDGVRTAATWAGIADSIFAAALAALGHGSPDELRLHALGRMRVALATIDRWLEHAALSLERMPESPAGLAGETRVAISDAARTIAALAAEACGARALAGGGVLDRARRDLDLFLLQHRLEPKLVQLGGDALAAAAVRR